VDATWVTLSTLQHRQRADDAVLLPLRSAIHARDKAGFDNRRPAAAAAGTVFARRSEGVYFEIAVTVQSGCTTTVPGRSAATKTVVVVVVSVET
jgi:hypothetical protein